MHFDEKLIFSRNFEGMVNCHQKTHVSVEHFQSGIFFGVLACSQLAGQKNPDNFKINSPTDFLIPR